MYTVIKHCDFLASHLLLCISADRLTLVIAEDRTDSNTADADAAPNIRNSLADLKFGQSVF